MRRCEELADLAALGVRELRVEERLEPVERQVQRVQQQVRGFVVRVGRPVAEGELRFAEARHRVAQPVAQRLEVVVSGVHAAGARRGEQPLEDAAVDRRERREIVDLHALVQLVDRRIDRAELDDLLADVGDEAAVGRAARAGKLGDDADRVAHRIGHGVDERARGP